MNKSHMRSFPARPLSVRTTPSSLRRIEMSRHDRHSAILDIVMDEGSVHIDDIITRLGVSAATARRDLDHLADQQLISRTRGGAIANPTSTEPPLRYRTSKMADEKTRIAKAAAALVHPGDSIGLNGGTTTTEVAREIALLPALTDPEVPVTLVTNAVNIANEMAVRQCVRVVVTGGIARARSFELTGPLASLILPSISVGTLFLGVEGLDERGAYAQHDGEAAINAALVEAAEHVVIVCDSSKLGRTAFALICPTSGIDTVITDDGACADQVEALRRAGVQVQLV